MSGIIVLDSDVHLACVPKCWENSKYVSNCPGSAKCLCDDAQFQAVQSFSFITESPPSYLLSAQAVLQCLYSQCQTAQFGSALHYAIAQCSENDSRSNDILPALVRHKALHGRAVPSMYASASVSASAIHSVARRQLSVSAPGNARPTRSAAYTSPRVHITPIPVPTSRLAAFNATVFNTTGVANYSSRAT